MMSTEGKFWSSRISNWEKATQSPCLMIQFKCQGTLRHGVEMETGEVCVFWIT
jgi:hypothetical protein